MVILTFYSIGLYALFILFFQLKTPSPIMPSVPWKAFGTNSAESPLENIQIPRRQVSAHDVEIEILYCGVCHSDLHQARNEWRGTVYPCVPGHEIVGRVTAVGDVKYRFVIDMASLKG
jgi:uncharacterized zinc-type alcohol dehydrogenase-like protein